MKKIQQLLSQVLRTLASVKLLFKPKAEILLGGVGTSSGKIRPLFLSTKESKKLKLLTYPTKGAGIKLVNDIK